MGKTDSMGMVALLAAAAACAPTVVEAPPGAVEVLVPVDPSARGIPDTSAPDRAPRGKGAFLSAIPFNAAKIENAKVKAGAVQMAAELQLTVAGSDRCPTVKDLVDSKKLDPKVKDDPWGNPYRVVCDDEVHVVSNGRDGVADSPDDVRDDASESELRRIGDL